MNAKINSKRKKVKRLIIIILTLVLIGVMGGVMLLATNFYHHYNNPPLIGEWTSEETGKTVAFGESGNIKVDNLITGSYKIPAPGIIMYEIDGYIFEMTYVLEERYLLWGLPGEEEKFERKGI